MIKILNMTAHAPTQEQKAVGVTDPNKDLEKDLKVAPEEQRTDIILSKANRLAAHASDDGAKVAMIGGHPLLTQTLSEILLDRGILPVYAATERVVLVEEHEDGTVSKTSVFKHLGFYPATAALGFLQEECKEVLTKLKEEKLLTQAMLDMLG